MWFKTVSNFVEQHQYFGIFQQLDWEFDQDADFKKLVSFITDGYRLVPPLKTLPGKLLNSLYGTLFVKNFDLSRLPLPPPHPFPMRMNLQTTETFQVLLEQLYIDPTFPLKVNFSRSLKVVIFYKQLIILSDCNGTRTHNHLVRKLNGWVFVYELVVVSSSPITVT